MSPCEIFTVIVSLSRYQNVVGARLKNRMVDCTRIDIVSWCMPSVSVGGRRWAQVDSCYPAIAPHQVLGTIKSELPRICSSPTKPLRRFNLPKGASDNLCNTTFTSQPSLPLRLFQPCVLLVFSSHDARMAERTRGGLANPNSSFQRRNPFTRPCAISSRDHFGPSPVFRTL